MINEALRLMRIFHDLSQKELASKLEVSKSYISELESGKKTPRLEIINKYSKFFDIPASSILFFSESLDKEVKTEELRVFVSSKVISMLNFIAVRSGHSYAQD